MGDVDVNDPRLPRADWSIIVSWRCWLRDIFKALRGTLYPGRPDARWWFVRSLLVPSVMRFANCEQWWLGPVMVVRPMPWLPGPARAHLDTLSSTEGVPPCVISNP